MSGDERRAERGAQRERVFAHKERILDLLDQGARHVTIKDDLGLQDIPRTTFQYLVRTIRAEAAEKEAVQDGGAPLRETVARSIAPSGSALSVGPETGVTSQPVRVPSEKREGDPPRQPAPRKRRKGFVVPQSRDAKDLNLDPSKWKTDR